MHDNAQDEADAGETDLPFAIPMVVGDLLCPKVRAALEDLIRSTMNGPTPHGGLPGPLLGFGLDIYVISHDITLTLHPAFAVFQYADGEPRRTSFDWLPAEPENHDAVRALWANAAMILAQDSGIGEATTMWPLPWSMPNNRQMFSDGPSAVLGSGHITALFLPGGITLLSQEYPLSVVQNYGRFLLDPLAAPEEASALAIVGIQGWDASAHGHLAARRVFKDALPRVARVWRSLFDGEEPPRLVEGGTASL